MILVLHNIGTLASGGMESFLLNIYRNIDREKVQFDFVVGSYNSWNEGYADEINKLGGHIYHIPSGLKGVYYFYKILQKHPEYQIVHSHRDAMSALFLFAAKKAGVTHRLAHSHNAGETGIIKQIATKILRPLLNKVSTQRLACGQEAGEHLFGNKNFSIIPNAINLSTYKYNSILANDKREELGLKKGDIIFGHVGRLIQQKNHNFLISIFQQIHSKNKDTRLLLVGDGELKSEIKQKIAHFNLNDSVLILSNRSDVNELLQTMNMVIFPSFYEGFSMAMVEMQASGLRILCSDQVPKEINITGNVVFKSINDSAEEWAKEALNLLDYNRDSHNSIALLTQAGLDIHQSAQTIQNMYLDLSKITGDNNPANKQYKR